MLDRRMFIAAVLALGLTVSISSAKAADATGPGGPSQDYVTKAAIGDLFEIASSKEALNKSHDSRIRAFAARMIKDHSAGSRTLKSIIKTQELAITLPSKLDDEHQQMLDRLKSAQSADFDKQYIALQTEAHQGALALHQGYAQSGLEPKLKVFAKQTVKIVGMHLKMLQGMGAS
jgi:putative membrane protein